MYFGCIILGIRIPCFGVWITYIFWCRTPEFACLLTQKALHNFCLCALSLWRDAASTIHHWPLLLPCLHLSSDPQVSFMKDERYTREEQSASVRNTVLIPECVGSPMRKSECVVLFKRPGKYCCCELKVTNIQGRELPKIWEKGGLPLWFLSSYRRAVAENEESLQPAFLGFF